MLHPTPSALLSLGSARITGLGVVEVAVSDRGVCAIALPHWNDHDLRLGAWEAAGFHARRVPHPLIEQVLRELTAYANGAVQEFQVPLDLRHLPPFTVQVLNCLRSVPAGALITYGQLALRAGSPRGARAVGGAVGRNPIPVIIPCHRVVAGNGIGGFGLGLACKRTLLALEGVTM